MRAVSIQKRGPPSVFPNAASRKHRLAVGVFLSNFCRSRIVLPTAKFNVLPAPQADSAPRVPERPNVAPTFWEAFGALGFPLVTVAAVCIVWTSWLLFLNVAPNEAANLLMNTSDYDSGNFWLIVERDPIIKWMSAAGLAVVDVCYVGVLVKMLTFRPIKVATMANTKKTRLRGCFSCTPRMKLWLRQIHTFYADLTGYNGANRKYFNLCHKVSDMVAQGLVLHNALSQGLPSTIVQGYACFVCVNGLSASLNILTARNSAFVEVLIDSVFDLIAAVIYPIIVLGYCFNNFNFDRGVYLANASVLPKGNFERVARVQADPAEVALFLINFDSLRINGVMDFMLSIGLNLSFCYRFYRVVSAITIRNTQSETKLRRKNQVGSSTNVVGSLQRSVSRWMALPFVAAGVFVVAFTHTMVWKSEAACAAYPECVVFAKVWDSNEKCPCIMLIDGNRVPMGADEWNSPEDVTDKVRVLAEAGLLQELQLINLHLPQWPEELRRCTRLRTISLIYSSTEEIPIWCNEFKKLQLLHIEGKYGSRNLVSLPSDLFSDLPALTFLHLGNHHNLLSIPPFDGTPNLRSITLAVLLSLKELPPVDKIPSLETLLLAHVPQVAAVPDLSPLTKLSSFTVFRPNHLCCNGFIGACNLEDSYCQFDPVFGIPGASCLESSGSPLPATEATRLVFDRFKASICQKSLAPFAIEALSDMPTPDRIAPCADKLYGQCEIPGVTSVNGIVGMCYSSRMQVVACNVDPLFIEVRKVEIERGVGLPCNPQFESWLGCQL